MNILDSSGWLEYFSGGPNADIFKDPLKNLARLIVPTICIYEVFRVVIREKGEDEALQAVALMRQGRLADLDMEIAAWAAKISLNQKLPMADSIIMATGLMSGSTIWTMDDHFKKLPGVNYIPKQKK